MTTVPLTAAVFRGVAVRVRAVSGTISSAFGAATRIAPFPPAPIRLQNVAATSSTALWSIDPWAPRMNPPSGENSLHAGWVATPSCVHESKLSSSSMRKEVTPVLATKSLASSRPSCAPSPMTSTSSRWARANCSTLGASRRQIVQWGVQNHTRMGRSAGANDDSRRLSPLTTSTTVTAGNSLASTDAGTADGRSSPPALPQADIPRAAIPSTVTHARRRLAIESLHGAIGGWWSANSAAARRRLAKRVMCLAPGLGRAGRLGGVVACESSPTYRRRREWSAWRAARVRPPPGSVSAEPLSCRRHRPTPRLRVRCGWPAPVGSRLGSGGSDSRSA